MKKLFTFLLALVASVSAAFAYDAEIDGIYYDFNTSFVPPMSFIYTAAVTYSDIDNKYSGSVVIPSSVSYNGTTYSVKSIGKNAFSGCSSLSSITIPNSVTSIGSDAFYKCSSLTSVHITDLAAWCKISFGNYNANPLFSAHNLYLNGELVKDLVIPNSVTSIGNNAFYGCSSLTSVTIGNSVTSIGWSAFSNCYSLTSITIPNSVISIGEFAFASCSSLTSVTIPNSVTSIGYAAFDGCSSLTSINVDSNNPNYSSVDGVLFNKDKTTLVAYPGGKQGAYTIPNSVTSIGGSAFFYCSSLTSITIPNSVTEIGEYAFYGCDKLVDVYCYATTPPVTEGENTFSNYNAFLYVPCESKKAYMVNAVWGNFKYIECISSEGIENIQGDEVQSTKVIKDGQVLILRNGKTYTMQGQEVK